MPIHGRTRVYFVVGDPVSQVQAPALFNPIFERYDVDAVLVPMQVAAERLLPFAQQVLASPSCGGLWLTIPHKPTLLSALARVDESGRVAQSVNAVRVDADGGWHGGLFDGEGLVGALRHHGVEPAGRRVLLVGAGGAGAAVAVALLQAGVRTLALHDLGRRAALLAERLGPLGAGRVVVPGSADPAGCDIVIHATPLGLSPDDPLPVDVQRIDAGAVVVDILMKPEPTPLLRACEARGLRHFAGFEMLVQQVPSYLRFFGLDAVADDVARDLGPVRKLIVANA